MRALISLLLALISIFVSTFGTAEQEPIEAEVPAFSVTEETVPEQENIPDLTYERYDPEEFYRLTEELSALGEGEDGGAVVTLYDRLCEEFLTVDAMNAIAYARYSEDVTDAYWSEESLYAADVYTKAGDALCAACARVMEGDCADALAERVGEDAALYFTEYEELDDRQRELSRREDELIQEYNDRMNTASTEAEYEYEGKVWTAEMLSGFRGQALAASDPEGYWEIYDGLCRAINDMVGSLFVELLSIRAETAEYFGYDSYNDYAYECIYGRSYTPEDAQVFCDAVKPLAREYNESLYYSDLWYEYDSVSPERDGEELLNTLTEYASQIDPLVYESAVVLREQGLCDLCDGENALNGAYTVSLSKWGTGFIYAHLDGSCYDFSSLTHEFGHFIDTRQSPVTDILTQVGDYDLFEIHSNGLEVLYSCFYDEIYDKGADAALFAELGGQLECIIDGCIQDEFQRRVYDDPDITLTEINRLYARICGEYGRYEYSDEDGTWVEISHNFEMPLYYISYAASSLAALQIWDKAREDYDGGVALWLSVLKKGAFEDSYTDVMRDCGLLDFTEENAVETVCCPVIEYLETLG